MSGWSTALATRAGVMKNGGESQDYARVESVFLKSGEEAVIAVVSDGAGSAGRSAEGAKITGDTFCETVSSFLNQQADLVGINQDWVQEFAHALYESLTAYSQQEKVAIEELSCTLVGAVCLRNEIVVIQLGDGAVVFGREGDYCVAHWPDHGEFVNETVFVTDLGQLHRMKIGRWEQSVDFVCLFTDGLELLVLNFKDKMPHARFFLPIEKAISAQYVGHSELVSNWMQERILGSDSVLSRTDDDLSLIAIAWRE